MHEFSICDVIVKTVLSELNSIQPPPKRLVATSVVVGELRQIVPEQLTFAYECLTKETAAQGSRLEIRRMPTVGECEKCGWRGEMPRARFECAACGSTFATIVGGKELFVENLEVEEE